MPRHFCLPKRLFISFVMDIYNSYWKKYLSGYNEAIRFFVHIFKNVVKNDEVEWLNRQVHICVRNHPQDDIGGY